VSADQYPDGIRDDDPAFDPTVSHQARFYNYLLEGKDHYEADRIFAEKVKAVYPEGAEYARVNRAFLGRAVRYLAGEAGISQYLDIGAGLPAPGATHEVAQQTRPGSKVVYVDVDPVVMAHARAFMTGRDPGSIAYVDADLRDPGLVLERAAETLDFTRPVGLLLVAVLHAIGDRDDPHACVATLVDALPRGSYLVLTHWGKDPAETEREKKFSGLAGQLSRQPYLPRSRQEISRFLDGLEIVEPGLVPVQHWRPDAGQEPAGKLIPMLGCIGRKP